MANGSPADTDRWTDMAKLKDTSRDYVNVPKNWCYDEMDMHNMGRNKQKYFKSWWGNLSERHNSKQWNNNWRI